jgi:hypothetical protein
VKDRSEFDTQYRDSLKDSDIFAAFATPTQQLSAKLERNLSAACDRGLMALAVAVVAVVVAAAGA